VLCRLHQTEMAFRQSQVFVTRDGAKNRNIQGGDRIGGQLAMALAGDAIEHHAGDVHGPVV